MTLTSAREFTIKMAEFSDHDKAELVERLSKGFAALFKQVDEIKRHSEAMEKLLGNDIKVRLIS